MPYSGAGDKRDRKPWEPDTYYFRLLKAEEKPNRFYHAEEWTDQNGKKRRPDDPVEQTQYSLTFECVKGEKKGDWAWFFCAHWYTADGRGKRAQIAQALDPDIILAKGLAKDWSDLIGKVCKIFVDPKDDPSYCRMLKFIPLKDSERLDAEFGEPVDVMDPNAEEIPF